MSDINGAEIEMDDLIEIMAEYPFRSDDNVCKELTLAMLDLGRKVEDFKSVTKCFVDLLVRRGFMLKKYGIDKDLKNELIQFVKDMFKNDPQMKTKIAATMTRRYKREKFAKLFP